MILRGVGKIYNLYWSKEKAFARKVKTVLGFVPYRLPLFKMAFYHKSMANGQESKLPNNERLEYLGDAILSTVVAEYLFKKYPFKDEGFLTKMRSKIVKRKTLNHLGEEMGLDVILADYSLGNISKSMLGNALEALIGALYIELGYAKTRNFVIKHILMKHLDIHKLETTDDNYKSQLLEWAQKDNHKISYVMISQVKENNRDKFKIGVMLNGKQVATAVGYNKKSAEQKASQYALSSRHVADIREK